MELTRLQDSAIFQIIGVQFKPEGYKPPPPDPADPTSAWLRRVTLIIIIAVSLAWVILQTPQLGSSLSVCGRLALEAVLTGSPGPVNLLRPMPWQ